MTRKGNTIKRTQSLNGSGYGLDILKKLALEATPAVANLLKPIADEIGSAVSSKINKVLHPNEQKGGSTKLAGQEGGAVRLAGEMQSVRPRFEKKKLDIII